MNNNCNGGSFISGIILGGLIGAALGILYAPKTGEETRRDLMKKAGEWKRTGLKKAEELSEKTKSGVEEFKKRARRAAKEFKGPEGTV